MDIANRLIKLLTETSQKDIDVISVKEKNLIEELNLSSVDALEILIKVEGEFDIMIDDSDLSLDMLSSFSNLENYITGKLGQPISA